MTLGVLSEMTEMRTGCEASQGWGSAHSGGPGQRLGAIALLKNRSDGALGRKSLLI